MQAYFPAGDWYDIYSENNFGEKLAHSGWLTLATPTTQRVPVHLRGGHIIVKQHSAMTTKQSMMTPFTIMAAVGSYFSVHFSLFLD